jgi:hypothetical protein
VEGEWVPLRPLTAAVPKVMATVTEGICEGEKAGR